MGSDMRGAPEPEEELPASLRFLRVLVTVLTGVMIAGIVLIVLGLGVFGYWGATGAEPVTKYKVPQVVVEEDDFGDKVEKTVMVDEFKFGLLPDAGYDGALPVGGGLGGLGIALVVFDLLKRRKEGEGDAA